MSTVNASPPKDDEEPEGIKDQGTSAPADLVGLSKFYKDHPEQAGKWFDNDPGVFRGFMSAADTKAAAPAGTGEEEPA